MIILVYGKSIELFPVNGTADSLVTVELSNWDGKVDKSPQTEINVCVCDDVTGQVYIPFFIKKDDGTDSVYIEVEIAIERLA